MVFNSGEDDEFKIYNVWKSQRKYTSLLREIGECFDIFLSALELFFFIRIHLYL